MYVDPTQSAAAPVEAEKAKLELEGKQVEDLRLEEPKVGQKFQLSAMATITEVMTGEGENGVPTSEICFELESIEVEAEQPARTMYPTMTPAA